MSLAPSMLDQFQDYAEGAGSVRNPLSAYADNSFENTRGGYSGFTIDPQIAGNTTATGSLTSYEPILVSPFCWGDKANFYASFAGIQNMSYTCTFGDLSRILSIWLGKLILIFESLGPVPGGSYLGATVPVKWLTSAPSLRTLYF
jgi:hypothetical protein